MIQTQIGGAARVDPDKGPQRPGFMIRDFALEPSLGDKIALSRFRGRSNLLLVFPGYSQAMHSFLQQAVGHSREFIEQDATIVVVVLDNPIEFGDSLADGAPFLVIHDTTQAVYRLSSATDENGSPVPLVYLTDRFGEIVATYAAPGHSMPPSIEEILSTFEFVNLQCPECGPPEWPR